MALQPRSDGCQCQTDNSTDDTWSVTSESAAARRHVLRAFTYLHVQDEDTGVTRLVAGPCNYTLKRNEKVSLGPQPMVVVPSAHYCIVESPVGRVVGLVAFDDFGQARLRHGEREVRLHQSPFPLYPGETLACSVQPLPVVGANQALRLRAVQDTMDNEGIQHRAGDEWLVKTKGAYILAVGEEVVELLKLKPITLTSRQYCVVCIPVMDGKPQRKILRGPQSFFLQPGETLKDGVRDIRFLQANEGLDLVAQEAFTDETVTPVVARSLGDRWTMRGPAAVVPPVEAEVLRQHSAIPLGPNEGVYVQNIMTGKVRAEMGEPYLLTVEERFWSKELSPDAERLLAEYRRDTGTGTSQRGKTWVVTFRVPYKSAAVVEDYRGDGSEVKGPELVTLQPDQQFRVFSLPGGTPVVLNYSQSLTLPLENAPIHLTDIINVTKENQKRCALTVEMAWNMRDINLVGSLVQNGDVNLAFSDVRRRLIECVLKNNNLSSEYLSGFFKFSGIHISFTEVLGLK